MPSGSLRQYLPRLVREWDDQAPGARHQCIEGSMVFVDVSGFTKMSERLARHGKVGAEEVTEVIGATFERLLAEAYSYGASLLKFGGDALLLFFPGEGHPLRACAAATHMRHALREIGRFQTTAGKVLLRMSVGVHSGAFDFFLVGGSHRELIVAGPAATETTNMESAAGAGQILVSRATAGVLLRENVGRELGPGFLLAGHIHSAPRSDVEPAQKREDLDQFIPRGLRDSLSTGEVEAEHRPAAVGFVHFMDFDRVAATDPAGAADSLDRLVRTVQQAVDSRGVTFLASDIAGDGGKIILAAGVPQATGNDEEQMLLALREIVAAPVDLPVQIGVNWGPVFAGEIGPSYRRTYTVMGDTVNLAARLMAKAPAGHVFASRDVVDGSRTIFETTQPEPFFVKGKKLPVQAFDVGDPIGSRGAADIATPLVGRDHELEMLDDAWKSAGASLGRVVELVAEPGMGKTRLLQEFLLRFGDSRTLRAECRLYQAGTPYFPFRTLLRQALELEGLDSEQTAGKLAVRVQEAIPSLAPWLALIGAVLDVQIEPSPEVAQLEDQFRPARTIAAVGTLLEAVITSRTLFVIEDTHWMDDASRELLAGLLVGLERQPWMFVLTRRPGQSGFVAPKARHVARVELQPLTPAQAQILIYSATGDYPLLPSQVTALAEKAAGNPLFLVELLRSLSSGSDVDSLPHSVEGLIAARIDRLLLPDRHLLRRLAVLGNGFMIEHAGAVVPDIDPGSRVRAIRRLNDFVTMNHRGWVQFRHALIRDVAYEALPFKSRAQLHCRVGDSIKAGAADDPDSQAELLSLHYFHAQNWADAWYFSRVAGQHASQIYANLEAAGFFRRALAAAQHLEGVPSTDIGLVAEHLGDALSLAGRSIDALRAYGRAGRLVGDEPVRRAELLFKRARTRARTGAYSQAFRETTIGRRLVESRTESEAAATRARLIAFAASVRATQGRYRDALRLAEHARTAAEAAGERAALARALSTLDDALEMLGHPDQAVFLPQALAIYEELGDLPSVAAMTSNMGVRAFSSGRWEEASEFYRKAEETWRRVGEEAAAAEVQANLAELLVNQRRLDEADEILDNAIRVMRAHEDEFLSSAEIMKARVILDRGDPETAERILRDARADAASIGLMPIAHQAAVYQALARVRLQDPVAALDLIDEVERAKPADPLLPSLYLARGSALAAIGQWEEAKRIATQGIETAARLGMPYEKSQLLLLRAKCYGSADGGPVTTDLAEASALLRGLGVQNVDQVLSITD